MRRAPAALALASLVFLTPQGMSGQGGDVPSRAHPGELLRVSLVTVGQGEVVWERFGHNAILFENEATGQRVAYHWGVFNFQQVDFVPRLIRGTMLYSMGPSDYQASLLEYRRVGRKVWIQELALTPDQRLELLRLVEENYRPENRDYRYDYYRDNCSTRVRDAIDHVLGGKIAARFAADTTRHTYRWHTRRILQAMPTYYLGIQLVLGPYADRPITVWEEMFLPLTLRDRIREVQVREGDGGLRSLVVGEELVLDSGRPPPPSSPPLALPWFLLAGILWGGGLVWLSGRLREPEAGMRLAVASGRLREPEAGMRLAVALLGGGWTLIAALCGTLLLAAWAFTDHFFWYRNYNLFQLNPISLVVGAGFFLFLLRGRLPAWVRGWATALAGLSLAGLALELVPGLGQNNAEVLALTIPMNLGVWASALRLSPPGGKGLG